MCVLNLGTNFDRLVVRVSSGLQHQCQSSGKVAVLALTSAQDCARCLTVSCALGPQNPVMHKPVPVSQVCAITKFVIVMALVIHLHYTTAC
jgi:hypothetical protein